MKHSQTKKEKKGWVALVGAGPGDPGLLTLRGRTLLKYCDLVVSDALVDRSVFSFAPQAKKIILGKRAGAVSTPQKNIERLLIHEAKKGRRIVRLKGGDPFVFGRGAEEVLALRKANVPFEIVPGVSAGHAVPAYAGIPLTHRDYSSQVTFVTGHEADNKKSGTVNWSALARLGGTIVMFMGLRQLPFILRKLNQGGLSSDMPISVIEWGTTPNQKVISGTMVNIERRIKQAQIQGPALSVIGKVNRLRPLLNWFERRPLFGERVVVTRAREQAGVLTGRLRTLGAEVYELPTIEIRPVPHTKEIERLLRELKNFDFLIFTSINGAKHFWNHLEKIGLDSRALAGVEIVAVGPGTSQALSERGIKADFVPPTFTTAHILKMLNRKNLIAGKQFLLARSDIATRELVFGLIESGAALVKDLVIYRTQPKHVHSKIIHELFSNGRKSCVAFTSASTVRNFVRALPARKISLISRKSRVISIGPVTTKTAKEAGLNVLREATDPTVDGLINATIEACRGKRFLKHRPELERIPLYED